MKIYIADIAEIKKTEAFETVWAGLLSEVELERWRHINDEARRLQFLIGHGLIHQVCKENAELDKNGKPTVGHGFISLAHRGDYVLLAVGENPVGVDIEDVRIERDYGAVARRLGWKRVPETALDFYRQFTAWEADYKLGQNSVEIQHIYYSINTFIMCISLLNKQEKIDFYSVKNIGQPEPLDIPVLEG